MGALFGGGQTSPAPVVAPPDPQIAIDAAENARKMKIKSRADHRAQFGVDPNPDDEDTLG